MIHGLLHLVDARETAKKITGIYFPHGVSTDKIQAIFARYTRNDFVDPLARHRFDLGVKTAVK